MNTRLHIANPRERAIVRLVDVVTAPLSWRRPRSSGTVERILLLRLERIGDLLMALEAIADVRRAWPNAAIDLAVGSWNADLARLIPGISVIQVVDVPWLSRGEQPASWRRLVGAATRWRRERYDLVVNFEPDVRTNLVAWLTSARRRAGYATGGGGAFLTDRLEYDTNAHVAANARRLIASVANVDTPVAVMPGPRLEAPSAGHAAVAERLGAMPRPWIGIHASGGRESKQWHLDRFAETARRLASTTGGTIVLTGGSADRGIIDQVVGSLGNTPHLSVAGTLTLPETVALIARLDVLVTGDTGPMHIAGAVGTPVVALFGPSDPNRYGPRGAAERIVRVDLWCSPCGLVRLPPERCRGHVPDCMDGIAVDVVVGHALDLLAEPRMVGRSQPA